MGIKTKTVTTNDAGSAHLTCAPCFFAGHDPGCTVGDELAGPLNANYTLSSMPFIEGKLDITGTPDTEYRIFVDDRL